LQDLASMGNEGPTSPDPVATDLVQPSTAREVAAAMKRASDERLSIVIRGAGTKMGWGRAASRIDVMLDMRRLNRVLEHQHGDLTATIEAGATLRDVNDALSRLGQGLPLDPPFADEATIGGILATNDSGPLRHRYGAPRDLVIGVQLATTDGELTKAGGKVVKNVAGYDLSRLVAGSFGSLAAIVSATFKLSPIPEASKTMRLVAPDAASLAHVVRMVMASQLDPIAFEISVARPGETPRAGDAAFSAQGRDDGLQALLRFASLPAAVDAQVAAATEALQAIVSAIHIVEGYAERTAWRSHASRLWEKPGAIVRASWLPAAVAAVFGELPASAELVGRAAVGAGMVRIEGDEQEQARVVEMLRHSPHFGNVVVVRGSPALKALVDVWGPQGDRGRLLASMKHAFDPHGVLNAGRGPL
jgi:glycolate oxidase FAD binding subunit